MQIKQNLFPGGVSRVLTMSYDDAHIHDRRLVEIFDRYGIKGTFHINSGNLGNKECINIEEVGQLYRNHEVSVHTSTHPFLTDIPDMKMIQEILEDKDQLEKKCGYPVRGMSYPFGNYSEHIIEIARNCGMEYSRTVQSNNDFHLPEDFMKWHPTTHHSGDLVALWEKFMQEFFEHPRVLYIWGHSFEFEREGNWDKIEEFCRMAGGKENVWYATNIQIKEYVNAVNRLVYRVDGTSVYNPSALDVWITVDEEAVCVEGGKIWSAK